MNEPNILVFELPAEVENTLNISGVPKAATIFYHENRWRFELKTGQAWADELEQRKRSFDKFRQSSNSLDVALGPFDFEPVKIEIKLSHDRCLYWITLINGKALETPVQRTRSPIAPIPLSEGYAWDAAKIPDGAKYSCWLNGSPSFENECVNAEPNEAAMLLLGGLAYLDREDESGNYRVIRINRFQPTDNGRLLFTESKKWPSEYTQTLIDQDRFACLRHIAFVERGVRHYAFINANEQFISSIDHKSKWIPTQYGAFLYLFNQDKSPNNDDCYYELLPDVLGMRETTENVDLISRTA